MEGHKSLNKKEKRAIRQAGRRVEGACPFSSVMPALANNE
jgi:hypothetical protein